MTASPQAARARPERGVQLVDVAVGVDARIGLADPRAVEEGGVAGVAGSRVDLHVLRFYPRASRCLPTGALAAEPTHARTAARYGIVERPDASTP